MFKKLKDKLAEEVKSSPQRIQQFAQAAQAAVTSASSSISDITNNDLFSIGDNDTSQNTTPRLQSSPHQPANHFQNVSLTQSQSELVDYPHEMDNQRQRKLSNSSFASDVSFRLPSYETPSMYHLQSDMEISASEADERGFSGGPATLDRVTKEQLYSAYKRTQERYTKYRNQYGDLARHYKLLERENAKARSVLVETQDKALRRISELKEQCALEQSAKAHLEKALRIEIEEKAMKIEALTMKVNLLQNADNTNNSEKNDVSLINLVSVNASKPATEEPTQSEVSNINNKIEKMEQLLNKYKESLKISKDKNAQITVELKVLSNDIENKNKQIQEMESTEEILKEANKKINELKDINEELQNQINSYDFTKIKERSSLEMDLQKANEEIIDLRGKIEVFSKKEEEYAISLAENKLSIHKELESKEAEIKSLKDALSASNKEVQSLKIVLDDYKNSISVLEEEKAKLNKDSTEFATTRTRIDEMNSQLQELSKKCQSLEQLKAKSDEEYKCLQLQMNQESAEKLAMIDRNVYLVSRNKQLSEENTKKSTQINNLENEISKDRANASAADRAEIDNLRKESNTWKKKTEKLESEIQEEREELVKLQTEIEKLLVNHESIQAQNAEFHLTIANLSTTNTRLIEKQTKIENIVTKMSQEANELRQSISLTYSETHSLFKTNKESFSSLIKEVHNLLNNSVQSLEKNIDITTSQYSDIMRDYEKLKTELATTSNENYKISNELSKLREENKNLDSNLKKCIIESKSIHEKLVNTCNQYEIVLEETKSAKRENETLLKKIKEFEDENRRLQDLSKMLEFEKQDLNNTVIDLDKKHKEIKEKFESVSKELGESVMRINLINEENQELAKSKTIEIEASRKIQAHIETEKAKHSAAVEQCKLLELEKNDVIERLKNTENKNKQLIAQLDELNLLHHNKNATLRELEEEIINKSEDLDKYKQIQASLEIEIAQHVLKIEEITKLESEKQHLDEEIKVIENKYKYITDEYENLKKLFTDAEESINKLKSDNKHKSEDCEIKMTQINELRENNKVLSDENIKLKNDVANFTNNIIKLESEISEIKKSHSEIEIEKDRLNEMIENLDKKNANENKTNVTETKDTQTGQIDTLDDSIEPENSMFENKWVLEHKQTAMTNTVSLNLKTNSQEDIIEQYAALKINYDALKDDNRRLHSDIEGLQSYLTKISKENSILNDKLREVIATSEHSTDNDQLASDINQLKNELQLGKEKVNDLLRENSLLMEENLELKDQLSSQNYSKPPKMVNVLFDKDNENIKEKYDELVQTNTEMSRRNDDLEEINKSVSGNNKQLQEKNEKLRLTNEKLERRLDEALVSLRHLHSLHENTELEYLRNILYEYLTGSGTHSLTLAKVLAAIVKFDDMQTQMILQKEKERQGFLRQLGII